MLSNLNKYTILLASKSPRRRELLHLLRIPFKVVTIGGIDESYPSSIPLLDVPQYVSTVKADAFQKHIGDDELVITADTMVICGNFILGKPKDCEDAVNMLGKDTSGGHRRDYLDKMETHLFHHRHRRDFCRNHRRRDTLLCRQLYAFG